MYKNKSKLHSKKLLKPSENKDFFEKVYEVARLIPPGKVTSYGAIAAYLGARRSARMVGWAMNNCGHLDPPIPAHRVVNRNGLLSGKAHFGPGDEMANLLRSEDIAIVDNQVKPLDRYFWDPMKELSL